MQKHSAAFPKIAVLVVGMGLCFPSGEIFSSETVVPGKHDGLSENKLEVPLFIDQIGEFQSESTPWRVDIRKDKPSSFGYQWQGVHTATSPKWEPHDGFFVCIVNDLHLWAFDGREGLIFIQVDPGKGSTVYSKETISRIPPQVVTERLPGKVIDRIKENRAKEAEADGARAVPEKM